MATVVILNTVGLVILFTICTVFFILLMEAYKRISKIEDEKAQIEERAEYHEKQLRRRAGGDENTNGYTLEERD